MTICRSRTDGKSLGYGSDPIDQLLLCPVAEFTFDQTLSALQYTSLSTDYWAPDIGPRIRYHRRFSRP